jgi:acetyl esterase
MRRRKPSQFLVVLAMTFAAQTAEAQSVNLPAEVQSAIREMGIRVDGPTVARTLALMQPLQAPRTDLAASLDVSYGEDALQKLDIYAPKGSAAALRPIVVFVHGGGFTGGDKRVVNNVASYFARHGMVGAAMNFRLAPAATWPEQSLDIGKAVAWLSANAAQYGGDPRRIVLIGYSSAAATVASFVFDQSIQTTRDGVVGAVLMSGFGYTGNSPAYYGDDPAKIAVRQPRAHINESKLPVLLTTVEFDPPSIGAGTHELAAAICARDGKCPPFLSLTGLNHPGGVASIDTADDRLGSEILNFIEVVAK